MNILWAAADSLRELNTSIHRIVAPSKVMSEGGHSCAVVSIAQLFPPSLAPDVKSATDNADIIVLERLLVSDIHPKIEAWRNAGKKVFCTFDDAYHLLPDSGGASKQTWRGGKDHKVGKLSDGSDKVGSILNEFRQGLKLVDGAFVPSKLLAEDYRPYCENIQYVPNFPYLPLWKDVKKRPRDNNFKIVWGGSSAHWESWSGSNLAQALGTVCQKHPRVQVHIQSRDGRIISMLEKAGVRYTAENWVKFEEWPQVLASADLGVAPLSGEYDKRRSFLKSFECSLAGIPLVASDEGVYSEAKGRVLVKNRAEHWANTIRLLMADKESSTRLVDEGREWAIGLYENSCKSYERAMGI